MECAQIFLMSYLDDVYILSANCRITRIKLPLGPWYDYSWLTNPLTLLHPSYTLAIRVTSQVTDLSLNIYVTYLYISIYIYICIIIMIIIIIIIILLLALLYIIYRTYIYIFIL